MLGKSYQNYGSSNLFMSVLRDELSAWVVTNATMSGYSDTYHKAFILCS
jgi:hypothetical protein